MHASPTLLQTYEQEHLPFARTLVNTTDRLFTLVQDQGFRGQFICGVVLPYIAPLVFKLPWITRLFFKSSLQIAVTYRGSSISQGKAGKVCAGDRLPWVEGKCNDNHEPLRRMTWQFHIYGKASPEFERLADGHDVPVCAFPWTKAAEIAGLGQNAIYLIRPDGYIGYACPRDKSDELEAYMERWGIGCALAHSQGKRCESRIHQTTSLPLPKRYIPIRLPLTRLSIWPKTHDIAPRENSDRMTASCILHLAPHVFQKHIHTIRFLHFCTTPFPAYPTSLILAGPLSLPSLQELID